MSIMIMGSHGKWQVWVCGRWSKVMTKREALSYAALALLTEGKEAVR